MGRVDCYHWSLVKYVIHQYRNSGGIFSIVRSKIQIKAQHERIDVVFAAILCPTDANIMLRFHALVTESHVSVETLHEVG